MLTVFNVKKSCFCVRIQIYQADPMPLKVQLATAKTQTKTWPNRSKTHAKFCSVSTPAPIPQKVSGKK